MTDWDFSSLRAMYINCTLKRSPEQSHTQGLMDISVEIMRRNGFSWTYGTSDSQHFDARTSSGRVVARCVEVCH